MSFDYMKSRMKIKSRKADHKCVRDRVVRVDLADSWRRRDVVGAGNFITGIIAHELQHQN